MQSFLCLCQRHYHLAFNVRRIASTIYPSTPSAPLAAKRRPSSTRRRCCGTQSSTGQDTSTSNRRPQLLLPTVSLLRTAVSTPPPTKTTLPDLYTALAISLFFRPSDDVQSYIQPVHDDLSLNPPLSRRLNLVPRKERCQPCPPTTGLANPPLPPEP